MFVHSIIAPFAIALLLSLHGLWKKSLSPDGALTAFMVGFGIMASPVKAFGIGLIAFYFTGSRATRYGKKKKAQVEEGYHEAGYRSSWQVLCNSICALIATTLWNIYFVPGGAHAYLGQSHAYGEELWCPTDKDVGGGLSRMLFYVVLGQFGCCLGDTLASELGILSPSRPRMITTYKPVPPGTNGAISAGGTMWSIIGGALVGSVMGVSLIVENGACDRGIVVECVGWGAVAGGVGSVVDSVLGATMQETVYSAERKKVVKRKEPDGERIGGRDVLTNNTVNLLSGSLTALLIGWVTSS
ncbi:hypothetical protein AX15_000977 [Amanita polypyramis BW_CC]|nr:hypothetical protein AX15_000977 [Amanita polypyramis BW_CC]